MRRRDFISLVGGSAVAWPLTARAQTAAKLPTIGLLAPATPAAHGPWFASLVQRLNELGWIEGRTVAIEQRYAEGRSDRYDEISC
jgi:putative ABC transport system substrate-binding protein